MRWILVTVVVLAIFVDLLAGLTGTSLTFLAGLGLLYAGERLFAEDTLHWAFTGGGVAALLLALGVRARAYIQAEGTRKTAQKKALIYGSLAAASLLLYAASSDSVVAGLGLGEEAGDRWRAVMLSLFPIVLLIGTIPMFVLDRALSAHPVVLPMGAAQRATYTGITAALAISLVFPVNYIASQINWEWDYAYFKVTAPGTSTLAIVETLDEPMEAYLFFSPGSDVGREVEPYFRALEAASGGKLVVQTLDQAVEPKLAEELKIRENGYVALHRGDATEKFKVGTDLDKAKRELKKLDETVQKNLLKLASGARVVYVYVGHGEASSKEKDEPLRKLNLFKQLLESQNYKIKNFGVTEGSADAVPDDAAFVVIAAPEKPLLDEEVAALSAYVDAGGRLLVMVEPGMEPLDGLLGALGLKSDGVMLANAKYFVPQTRGPSDRVLLFSNRFGSHEAVSTLSKRSAEMAVLMPTVTAIAEIAGGKGKSTVLVRTPENTWPDADGDRQQGGDEKGDVHNVAYAVSGPEGSAPEQQFRAIVTGDVSIFSDPVLQVSTGNQQLVLDATRWLVGDEDLAGSIESEEDVKIEHTREEDVAWFYGTIFGVPMLVLVGGLVFTSTRRRVR